MSRRLAPVMAPSPCRNPITAKEQATRGGVPLNYSHHQLPRTASRVSVLLGPPWPSAGNHSPTPPGGAKITTTLTCQSVLDDLRGEGGRRRRPLQHRVQAERPRVEDAPGGAARAAERPMRGHPQHTLSVKPRRHQAPEGAPLLEDGRVVVVEGGDPVGLALLVLEVLAQEVRNAERQDRAGGAVRGGRGVGAGAVAPGAPRFTVTVRESAVGVEDVDLVVVFGELVVRHLLRFSQSITESRLITPINPRLSFNLNGTARETVDSRPEKQPPNFNECQENTSHQLSGCHGIANVVNSSPIIGQIAFVSPTYAISHWIKLIPAKLNIFLLIFLWIK